MLDEMSKAELLLVIRNLRERIRAFESGEKYTRMKEDHRKAREADARLIRRRERELARQFSQKTKEEREDVFRQMATAPILQVDFSFGRVNGKQGAVIVSVINEQRRRRI